MKKLNPLRIAGGIIGIASFIMAWHFYDYKLALILFLALLGNNLERIKIK